MQHLAKLEQRKQLDEWALAAKDVVGGNTRNAAAMDSVMDSDMDSDMDSVMESIEDANAHILRLNIAGNPVEWLTWQEATTLYARDLVTWTLGETVRTVRGGTSKYTGCQSRISLHSIIACAGELHSFKPKKPALTNRILFRRDQNLCMYCGKSFADRDLSCDHILPTSRGGRNTWANVVAACKRCNHYKQNRTPEEAHMQLLALPFEPNPAEYLALVNSKRIRADQMDFLKAQFSRNCRVQ